VIDKSIHPNYVHTANLRRHNKHTNIIKNEKRKKPWVTSYKTKTQKKEKNRDLATPRQMKTYESDKTVDQTSNEISPN